MKLSRLLVSCQEIYLCTATATSEPSREAHKSIITGRIYSSLSLDWRRPAFRNRKNSQFELGKEIKPSTYLSYCIYIVFNQGHHKINNRPELVS